MPRPTRQPPPGLVRGPAREILLRAPFALEAASASATAGKTPALNPREFAGVAAVYGNQFERWSWEQLDTVATVLEPGAFARSIAAINARPGDLAGNIPLDWEHQILLGRSLMLEDTPRGIECLARVSDARELDKYAEFIRDRTANGMSIGFNILQSTQVADSAASDAAPVEHVIEAELVTITACLWGANPLATIEAAASASPSDDSAAVRAELSELRRLTELAHLRIDTLAALAGLPKE